MRASELITEEIPPLLDSDTGEKALIWMEEFKVKHLPVLKQGNYVGILSEDDVLDKADVLNTLDQLFQHLPRPFVYQDEHIYHVLARIAEFKLSAIPILDREENYLGCTTVHHLLTLIANTGSIKEMGGIIVLEITATDYSLAEISQIVESNEARILSSFIMSSPDSTKLEVTLKINQVDLGRIMRTFERYDYVIKDSFQRSSFEDDLQFRYDTLMKYLNL